MGSLEAGEIVGRFKIAEEIGSGGMCDVYLAVDSSNFGYVALKVLNEELTQDPKAVSQFQKEGQLARNISHPNVVAIIDDGEADGFHYIAYEHISGLSLAELIEKSGALESGLALSIFQEVSLGLVAAHQKGIVHCDLKPQNIMITGENRIKIIDFGIASFGSDAFVSGTISSDEEMDEYGAEEGQVQGTLVYAAPEQNQGQLPDTYSDVYSLGLIFYEMLAGKRLLQGTTMKEVVLQQLTMKGRLKAATELNAEVPPAIDPILAKMLDPKPQARYKSAVELVQDLEEKLAGEAIGTADLEAAKDLAMRELSETYFATASNALHDGRIMDALLQFAKLLNLNKEQVEKYGKTVQRELIGLFWRLQGLFKDVSDGIYPKDGSLKVDLDTYLTVLQKLGAIFSRIDQKMLLPLIERRICLIVRDCKDDDERLRYFRQYLATCPFFERSVIVMADYLEACRRQHFSSEVSSVLGYLGVNFEREGLLDLASFILTEAITSNSQLESLEERKSKIDAIIEHREAARKSLLEKVEVAKRAFDLKTAREQCVEHLKKYRLDAEVLKAYAELLELRLVDSRTKELAAGILLRLCRLYFLQEELTKAKACARHILRIDPGNEMAINYLFEILIWYGKRVASDETQRKVVVDCLVEADAPEAAIMLLERDLHGRLTDLDVFHKILELARDRKVDIDKADYYFRMGVCAFENTRVRDAKHFFNQAIEEAPDPKDVVVRLKSVRNIASIFGRRELLEKLRRVSK